MSIQQGVWSHRAVALSDLIVSVNKMNKWAAVSACISSLQVPLSWPVACIIISTKKKKKGQKCIAQWSDA